MQTHKLTIKRSANIFFILMCLVFITFSSLVSAVPNSDLQSILDGTAYYDPGASSCGLDGGVVIPGISSTASTSGSWNGPTTGPYYLEEFAIQVLQDVAQKTNTPTTSTVTQEHVLALVAWFYREGGDIGDGAPVNNYSPNLFNPLNTSIQDPSLESTTAGGGIESFKSFNDGVEGTARTIVGSYQNRIAGILTEEYSTAEQVANTVADFQNYPGNLAWAVPSEPGGATPTRAEIIADNQNNYLPSLLQVIEQVRSNYVYYATMELGTPEAEAFIPKDHVPASKLMYEANASSTTGISTSPLSQPSKSASISGCTTNISCNNSSPSTASSSQLSQLRQNVVCIATNELKEHWTPLPLTSQQYSYYTTYTEGRGEEWCADFASWTYNQAGYPFASGGSWDFPGVVDIYNLGTLNQNFQWHPASSNYAPVPGDLAIYHFPGSSAYYSHVEIVVAVNGQSITTIGGDETNPDVSGTIYGGAGSNSIMASTVQDGYYNGGIIGYVSPNH